MHVLAGKWLTNAKKIENNENSMRLAKLDVKDRRMHLTIFVGFVDGWEVVEILNVDCCFKYIV